METSGNVFIENSPDVRTGQYYAMKFEFDTFEELMLFSREIEKSRIRKRNQEIRRQTLAFLREHPIYTYKQARDIIQTQFHED